LLCTLTVAEIELAINVTRSAIEGHLDDELLVAITVEGLIDRARWDVGTTKVMI